jgi:hypothetical protein
MKHYEIRIFNSHGRTSLIFHQVHADDRAAIQAAKEIAAGQLFDVWLGMDCVFAMHIGSGQRLQ